MGQLAGNPCLDEHHLPFPWRVGLVPKQQDPGQGDWDIHQLLERPVLKREVLAEGRSCRGPRVCPLTTHLLLAVSVRG